MEENERPENIEELEPTEAIEELEPPEEPPETAAELSRLTNEAREELPAEESSDEEDDEDDDDEPTSTSNKIGFGAWLAAIAVFLFALAAFIPALWNTQLSLSAVKGLVMESRHRYSSASDAYGALAAQDQTAQQWAEENFSFGSSEAPVFSAGNFVLQRFAFLIDKLNGPYNLQNFMGQQPYFNPEGTIVPRYPRYLKPALAKVEALDEASQKVNDAIDDSYHEADPETQTTLVLEAIQAVRKSDKDETRNLFYDAIELGQLSMADPTSKETGKLLAAVKKAPGSEPWMYVSVEYARAMEAEDYQTLAGFFSREFTRNREDYSSLAIWIKALHLNKETKQAQKLIKKYSSGEPANLIQAMQAELLIRDGKYKEAVKLCNAVLKNPPPPLDGTTPQTMQGDGAQEAAAQKGAALLLLGEAQQALDFLRPLLDAPYGGSSTYIGTLLSAAILAGDDAYLAQVTGLLMQEGYEIPEEVTMLMDGTITLEEIYTTGWGGF